MFENEEVLASDDAQERAALAGARAALIERFGIRGLYGYRDISLSSKHAATILIARNGTGKTTLLGALDAFLKLQLYRLRELEFSEIYCRLRGIPEDIVLTHDDLVAFLQASIEGEIGRLASRAQVDAKKLLGFLFSDYESSIANWHNDHDQNSITNSLYRAFSHDSRAVKRACSEAYTSLFRKSTQLEHMRSMLEKVLEDFEIVYLPTYRRVELALSDNREERRHLGRSKPKLNLSASGLHTAEIQFGLGDISERLSQLRVGYA